MITFVFFDINESNIQIYKQTLGKEIKKHFDKTFFVCGDIRTIIRNFHTDYSALVIVSPANSFGNMKGGIDFHILAMYPQCETHVKNAISNSKYITKSGMPHIPVGKCKIINIQNTNNYLLIAPTMFTPRDINYTNNVLLAFKAIYDKIKKIYVAKELHNIIVVCSCLGTGIGNLSANESAQQILSVLLSAKYNT